MSHRDLGWIESKRQQLAPTLDGMSREEVVILLLVTLDGMAIDCGDREGFWWRIMEMVECTIYEAAPGPDDKIH